MSNSKSPAYTAKLKVMGNTFTAKGKSIYEAIEKLKPGNVAGMCILTVSKGKNKKDQIIPHSRAKGIFNSAGIMREARIKNVSILFDGV